MINLVKILGTFGLIIAIALILRGVFDVGKIGIKSFSSKLPILKCTFQDTDGSKTDHIYDLEKKRNRELEVENIKKEKNELRKKIKEGKILFKEEIINGLIVDKDNVSLLKSEYNIINDINKDRYLKLQEIKKYNSNIRMEKDKIRLDINKLSQHGSCMDLYEKIVTREDYYDYVKMFLEELV